MIDNIERVTALAHDHDPGHHFAGSIQICRTAPNVRPEHHVSDIFNPDRRPILVGEHDIFEILRRFNVTTAPNHVLSAAKLEQARPGLAISTTHRIGYPRNRDAVGTQAIGIYVDLILLCESAERCHLGHARNRFQVILEIPILVGTKLSQAVLTGLILENVLEDPAQPGRIRTKFSLHSLRQTGVDRR